MERYAITKPKYIKKKKRIGRGSTRGVKCGRGNKGQNSRSGANIRPAFRDELKRIPKLRGHGKNRSRHIRGKKVLVVSMNIAQIENCNLDMITPQNLVRANIVNKMNGKIPRVKILGMGEIKRKVRVSGCSISESAKNKIIKSGGNCL